jgi:hypothetical protein
LLLEPRVAGVAHGGEQPSARVDPVKAVEEFKRAQIGLLNHISGIIFITHQPAGQIIGGVEMRHNHLLEALQFFVTSQR